jgi:hypothetical protein
MPTVNLNASFERFINVLIVVNTLLMCTDHFGQSDIWTEAMTVLRFAFTAVFALEVVVKLTGLGHTRYFQNSWNRFDFVVSGLTLTGDILEQLGGVFINDLRFVHALRAFRALRIVRLLTFAPGLHIVFNAVVLALPGLGNLTALLLLICFSFAAAGQQLFAKVQLTGHLDETANFQTFPRALLTLFRSATRQDWNGIMYSTAGYVAGDSEGGGGPSGCDPDPAFDENVCEFQAVPRPGCTHINGCGQNSAHVFFWSFLFFVSYIFLNLFVAVILEGYEAADAAAQDGASSLDELEEASAEGVSERD